MTLDEIKTFIAQQTDAGLSLSAIQDKLAEQDVKISFLELRLLASEIESVLAKKKEEKTAKTSPGNQPQAAPESNPETDVPGRTPDTADTPASPAEPPAPDKLRGKTTVSLSPIQRPGYLACGSVSFGSGATADWLFDQAGRLELDNSSGGKPDAQDLREFQEELRKAFGA